VRERQGERERERERKRERATERTREREREAQQSRSVDLWKWHFVEVSSYMALVCDGCGFMNAGPIVLRTSI